MGKKSGNSWLTAVKRAFRSPTKDSPEKVRNCRRKQDHPSEHHDDDDYKKKEKRRWLFRKAVANQQEETGGGDVADQRHAIAVAVATAAAAEAAVATAHAAMEVARLARPGSTTKKCNNNVNHKQHSAAVVIQTSFRGYLARRALRALKGLVKLQALVRGHNVRKQAKMTLKCMQALVRVQSRVLDQRMRLSHEGSRFSAFSDTTSILEARYLQDIAERRSLSHSREPSSIADDWDERPHKIEEVKAMLQSRKEAAFKREKSLSQAFSQQMWRSDRSSMGEEEREETPKWLDRWMASKQWDSTIASSPAMRARASIDHHRDSIKTVEMDTSQPFSYFRRSSISSSCNYQPNYHNQRPASPLHSRAHHSQPGLVTPSPVRARPIQVRSASPRCAREDRGYYTSNVSQYSQTPSLRSNYYYNKSGPNNCNGSIPNYMAATESAKARVRSQSAPRQRPSTPERDRPGTAGSGAGPKKRLSFPNPDPYGVGNEGYNLRSPSFKSVIEQQTNYSSCCMDSFGGELSPSSTSDLRRWLR